ncbi:YoaK family protein [Devosia sp.]|uniref:YoaK family protein n=1 Tax=Devosia sp. TaxID=1871048 RepID=UPI00260569F3|nr:YoaK family protein [Devosia sp.]
MEFGLRDWLLIALTFAAGTIDAISYFGLGRVFSAFQTGNIVYLGFGLANAGGPPILPIVCSVAFFAVGAFLGTRATMEKAPNSVVWPGRVSATLGVVVVIEAIVLAVWMTYAGHPTPAMANVLIALLSLAMGMQTAAVRALGVQGVFTTAATFTLVAFAGDFAGSRPKEEQPRLFGVLVGLIAGAFAGGLLFVHALAYAPVLPLVVTVVVTLAGMALLREQKRDGTLAAH